MKLPELGQVLAGKYRLDEIIGEGGFAIVFRAVDLTVDRPVALKVLKPRDSAYDHTLVARFVREAKVVADLRDPHTVQMFDFGRADDGIMFMVFELLAGVDLAQLLEARGPLSERETEHVMRQVLLSLREAHGRGLIHRDIKPANIRIFEYQHDPLRAKLMDFGIARHTGPEAVALTKTGDLVGTIAYMAPEQAVSNNLTPAADLYSLGLVCFEMLAGESRSARGATASGRTAVPPCGDPLASVISWMLAARAADRPQSADAVLAALTPSEVIEPPTTPVAVVRVDSVGAPLGPSPRNLRVLGVIVLLLLVLSAGVGLAHVLRGQSEADSEQRSLQPVLNKVRPATPIESDAGESTEIVEVAVPQDLVAPSKCRTASPELGAPHRHLFQDGIDAYRFRAYIPRSYDAARPAPVLVAFHIVFSGPLRLLQESRLADLAEARGMVLILPNELLNPSADWMTHFDPFVVRGMVRQVGEEACLDESRIFILGHGSGAAASESLICEPWVRAMIMMSHRSTAGEEFCPTVAKPTLFFAPMQSMHLPKKGGRNCTGTRSMIPLREQVEELRERNRCRGSARIEEDGKHVCHVWDCEAATVVCEIEGGLLWPDSGRRKQDLLRCDGDPPVYDYLGRIGSFLDQFN